MFKRSLLQPNFVLGGTVIKLTPEILRANQIKGMILDVDETLVPFKNAITPDEVTDWADQMRQIVDIWLVSNNLSENRIGKIAQGLDFPYFAWAKKPSRRKLRQAAQKMNLPEHKIAMVGDRLFTDVVGGNRLGMFTILVEPMAANSVDKHKFSIRNTEIWIAKQCGISFQASK